MKKKGRRRRRTPPKPRPKPKPDLERRKRDRENYRVAGEAVGDVIDRTINGVSKILGGLHKSDDFLQECLPDDEEEYEEYEEDEYEDD